MRIEYKEENEQTSKNEPEIIHESDLTKQQKRRREWEKVRGMSGKKRLAYFWTYYKIWLLVPVLLIAVISTGVQIYNNSLEEPVLYINVSGTVLDTEEGMQKLSVDLLERCGSGGTHETVPVTTNVIAADDYNSSVQMSIWLSTGDMDILICDEATCKKFQEQEIFRNISELSGDSAKLLEKHVRDGILYLEDRNWTQYGLVTYEPVCAGILNISRHTEAAAEALLYLCGETK